MTRETIAIYALAVMVFGSAAAVTAIVIAVRFTGS
jgi:hypothetical protein